eukprot:scaffold115044_cov24-Attheya_sp.AAC.1
MEGNPQEIANTIWACDTLRIKSPNLLLHVEKNAKRLVQEIELQAITNPECDSNSHFGIESPMAWLKEK